MVDPFFSFQIKHFTSRKYFFHFRYLCDGLTFTLDVSISLLAAIIRNWWFYFIHKFFQLYISWPGMVDKACIFLHVMSCHNFHEKYKPHFERWIGYMIHQWEIASVDYSTLKIANIIRILYFNVNTILFSLTLLEDYMFMINYVNL